jgi:hypothetical protein
MSSDDRTVHLSNSRQGDFCGGLLLEILSDKGKKNWFIECHRTRGNEL